MKKFVIILLLGSTFCAKAQGISFPVSYSPTFDTYYAGLGFVGEYVMVNLQVGGNYEVFSLGGQVDAAIAQWDYDSQAILLGAGVELLNPSEEINTGTAVYGSLGYRFGKLALSYGFGVYEAEEIYAEYDAYHQLRLMFILDGN